MVNCKVEKKKETSSNRKEDNKESSVALSAATHSENTHKICAKLNSLCNCYQTEMSKNQKLKRIEEKDLPILYRLLIKIPLKSLGLSNGIFWALVCPILVLLNF